MPLISLSAQRDRQVPQARQAARASPGQRVRRERIDKSNHNDRLARRAIPDRSVAQPRVLKSPR